MSSSCRSRASGCAVFAARAAGDRLNACTTSTLSSRPPAAPAPAAGALRTPAYGATGSRRPGTSSFTVMRVPFWVAAPGCASGHREQERPLERGPGALQLRHLVETIALEPLQGLAMQLAE